MLTVQGTSSPTLTLNVGGVEFCLVPDDVKGSVQFSRLAADDENDGPTAAVTLNLTSYTGKIVVYPQQHHNKKHQHAMMTNQPSAVHNHAKSAVKVTPKASNNTESGWKKKRHHLETSSSALAGIGSASESNNEDPTQVKDECDEAEDPTKSWTSTSTDTPNKKLKTACDINNNNEKQVSSLAVDEDDNDEHMATPNTGGVQKQGEAESQTQATLLAQMSQTQPSDFSQTQQLNHYSQQYENNDEDKVMNNGNDDDDEVKAATKNHIKESPSAVQAKSLSSSMETPNSKTSRKVMEIMNAAESRPSSPVASQDEVTKDSSSSAFSLQVDDKKEPTAPPPPKLVPQKEVTEEKQVNPSTASDPLIDAAVEMLKENDIISEQTTQQPKEKKTKKKAKNNTKDRVATASSLSCDSSVSSHESSSSKKHTDECSRVSLSPEKSVVVKKPTPPSPSARWGHTVTSIGNNRFLVYGGQGFNAKTNLPCTLGDLHVYDMNKQTWYKPFSGEGSPRQWHTATYLPARQLMLAFGGESMNPKSGKVRTHQNVTVLDTELMVWYPPVVSGEVPSGRSGHAATMLDQDLVVFGGVKGSKWLNTVSVLNTSSWIWRTLKIQGSAPKPRSYHSATTVGNRIVIFGGNDAEESFATVHILEKTQGEDTWQWTHPMVTGYGPSARTGHSATLLPDGKTIYIYGGWDPNDDDARDDEALIFNDAFLLNTESWQWQKLTEPLPKRVGHESVLFQKDESSAPQIVSFGGRIPKDLFTDELLTLDPSK